MKIVQIVGKAGVLLAVLCLLRAAEGGTNSVPWSDSFEPYAVGSSIVGTNGWSGRDAASGMAVANPPIAAYTNTGGRTYPLATTHTNVLLTTSIVSNSTGSATGGVVAIEFLAWPGAMTADPLVSTNLHCAFYVDTNSHVVIWHQNRSGGVTNNEWRALADGDVRVDTNGWNRFTVIQDYGHSMFRIRVNEATDYLSDSAGWSQPGPGGTSGGTWFFMVKTNAWLSRVMLGCDSTNYVDDLLLATRSVTWTPGGFQEAAANDGTIDPATVYQIAVAYDTFAGTNNETLGGAAVTVTNVPDGLTGVVTRVDATHLRLTFTGQAALHEAENSVSNLAVVLKDGAFTLGNAADVSGISNGTISITYSNRPGTGTLTPSGTVFDEAAANDGSIGNTLALTLEGATFTAVSPLVEDTHYTVSNRPAGLFLVVDRTDSTTTVVRLTNAAVQHAYANSTNLGLTFLDAAFQGTPASNVVGRSLSLAVNFDDQPVLTYSGTNFHEAAANNGTIATTNTITLAGDTFTNAVFTEGVQYTAPSLPAALTFAVTYVNPSNVTVTLGGSAGAHAASNSAALAGFAFRDAAFGTVAAANIDGSASGFSVVFSNQPLLTASGATFTEAAANNGSIATTNTITLAGSAAFANATFSSNTHYTVDNVPDDLQFGLAYANPTQLTATLSGTAASHAASHSVSNVLVTFLDPAFTGIAAANVEGPRSPSPSPSPTRRGWSIAARTSASGSGGRLTTRRR